MIVLNDYFHNEKKASNGSISVSGKLEAYIGNYFVSGEGILDEKLLLIYYDPEIDFINPDHFSVNEIIYSVRKTREP